MSGSGREALPDIRERLGVPPASPGVIVRPSLMFGSARGPFRMSGNGLEALPIVLEWSGGSPG